MRPSSPIATPATAPKPECESRNQRSERSVHMPRYASGHSQAAESNPMSYADIRRYEQEEQQSIDNQMSSASTPPTAPEISAPSAVDNASEADSAAYDASAGVDSGAGAAVPDAADAETNEGMEEGQSGDTESENEAGESNEAEPARTIARTDAHRGKSATSDKPVMSLVAKLPPLHPIRVPFVGSPPKQAIERRETIIERTGSPPELHHAQVRQAAERVTQGARDAQRMMIWRIGNKAKDTRISIEDMADEVWKATSAAVAHINRKINESRDFIERVAQDEIAHVEYHGVATGQDVQQTRDDTMIEIYDALTLGSREIEQAETIAMGRYEQKRPAAERFISQIPESGRVGRLAVQNAEGEFTPGAYTNDQGIGVVDASAEQAADFETIDRAKKYLGLFIDQTVNRLSPNAPNLKNWILARTTLHLNGYSDQEQTRLVQTAQMHNERLINNRAVDAQFMTMVLGLTTPISDFYDEDKAKAQQRELETANQELSAAEAAVNSARFTLNRKFDQADQYFNQDLRSTLTNNLWKVGRNARDGLLEQAQQTEIGLNSARVMMADDYEDLVRRLDTLLPADKFLNAQELLPRLGEASKSNGKLLSTHLHIADAQATNTLDAATRIKQDNLDAIAKNTQQAVQSVEDVITRTATDMSNYASMITGAMSNGARANSANAREYAERMVRGGILSTNEQVRGRALDQIDNIAGNFFNSAIDGAEQSQFNSLKYFVERMESDDNGAPLKRPMIDTLSDGRTRASEINQKSRGPDPTVMGIGAVASVIPVVAVGTAVYAYENAVDGDRVVELLSLPWPAAPGIGDMFKAITLGQNLEDRISNNLYEPERSTALGLFSDNPLTRGQARINGMRQSTGWFDLNTAAREALGEGMSEQEYTQLQQFSPGLLRWTQLRLTNNLKGHEQEIALAFLSNNHERAIAARTMQAIDKERHSVSWDWKGSVDAARRQSDAAAVDAIRDIRRRTRESLEMRQGFVTDAQVDQAINLVYRETASILDPRERKISDYTLEQGQQAMIGYASRSYNTATVGLNLSPLSLPIPGGGMPGGLISVQAQQIEMSSEAKRYITDAVTLGSESDQARASLMSFELERSRGQSVFGLGLFSELSENDQTRLSDAIENPRLGGLAQQLAQMDERIANASGNRRERLLEQRTQLQQQYEEERGSHRKRMQIVAQQLGAAPDIANSPEAAERFVAERTGDVFAQADGITRALYNAGNIIRGRETYSHATYGREMVMQGRATWQATAALATEGWGTHEALLHRGNQNRTEAERSTASAWWRQEYGEDMEVALGMRDATLENVMRGEATLGQWGIGSLWTGFGSETSGDDALKLRRDRIDRSSDLGNLRYAAVRHRQTRVAGTGQLGNIFMDGSNEQVNLDSKLEDLALLIIEEANKREPGVAERYRGDPCSVFGPDGELPASIRNAAFDADGKFLGDRFLFADFNQAIDDHAVAYERELARFESILTTTIAILALIATVAAMLIPGVNAVVAGVAIAIIAGTSTMLVKAGMRGQRYGWEEAATDAATTAVEAASAGFGGALGGGLGKANVLARLGAGINRGLGRVGGAVVREAISGALSGGAQVALQDATWSNGFSAGLGNIFKGAARNAAVSGVSAGVSEGVTTGITRTLTPGKASSAIADSMQGASQRIGPHRTAAITEAASEFFGGAAGEALATGLDYAQTGKFNAGEALKRISMSAFRDMAVGSLRGAVNSVNRQRYRQMLDSARERSSVSDAELKAIRLVGISAGALHYDQNINHVRSEINDSRGYLSKLPRELRKQASGFDNEQLQQLVAIVHGGGFTSTEQRREFLSGLLDSIPGLDLRKFAHSIDSTVEASRRASERMPRISGDEQRRIVHAVSVGLDPSLRPALEDLPMGALRHLSPKELAEAESMIARGQMDAQVADRLFRTLLKADPEADENNFLHSLSQAVDTANHARTLENLRKQRIHKEVMESVAKEDRPLLAGMPDASIERIRALFSAGDNASPREREALYRIAQTSNPNLSRTAFDRLIRTGSATIAQRKMRQKADSRTRRQAFMHNVAKQDRHLLSALPDDALLELRIRQLEGEPLSPAERLRLVDAARREDPDIDEQAFNRALDDAVVRPLQAVSEQKMRAMRQELASGLPRDQRGVVENVPLIIMRDGEFEAFTHSQKGRAVTLIIHGRPVVVVRESASMHVLREEGIHVLQSKDPEWASRVGALDERSLSEWDRLSLAEQLALYKNKLDIEIDAQHRLIDGLETELAQSQDPAIREMLNKRLALTEAALGNLMRRQGEVASMTHLDLMAIEAGVLGRPKWLDQPARLFFKDEDKLRTDTEPIAPERKDQINKMLGDDASDATAARYRKIAAQIPDAYLRRLADASPDGATLRTLLARVKQPDANRMKAMAKGLALVMMGMTDTQRRTLAHRISTDMRANALIVLREKTGDDKLTFQRLLDIATTDGDRGPTFASDRLNQLVRVFQNVDATKLTLPEDKDLALRLLAAVDKAKRPKRFVEQLHTVLSRIEDPESLLRWIVQRPSLDQLIRATIYLHGIQRNTPTEGRFEQFVDLVKNSRADKIELLRKLTALIVRLDAEGREALATLLTKGDKTQHVAFIKRIIKMHTKVIRPLQKSLDPGNRGLLLKRLVQMAVHRPQVNLFMDSAEAFFRTLNEMVKTPEHLAHIKQIFDYIYTLKSKPNDASLSERLYQVAIDITVAGKQLRDKASGELQGLAAREATIGRQVKNLDSAAEGRLAGKDVWSEHLASSVETYARMQDDANRQNFAEVLRQAHPDWDEGQLGAMKPLQAWFEKLARMQKPPIDPRSYNPAEQKRYVELIQKVFKQAFMDNAVRKAGFDPRSNDPDELKLIEDYKLELLAKIGKSGIVAAITDIKVKDRFSDLSRTLREMVVSEGLRSNSTQTTRRKQAFKKYMLRKMGISEADLQGRTDAGNLERHISALIDRLVFYKDMDRLARSKSFQDLDTSTAGIRQNITEVLGEMALTAHMMKTYPDMLLAMPFGKGTGFDQVWIRTRDGTVDGTITEVVIGEAKGLRASLGNPQKGDQMTLKWVSNTLREMAASTNKETRKLAKRLIEATNLPKGGVPPKYRGIVVQVKEVEKSKASDTKTYEPNDITTPSTGGDGYDFTNIDLPKPESIKTD